MPRGYALGPGRRAMPPQFRPRWRMRAGMCPYMQQADDTMGFSFSELWEKNKDKLMQSAEKGGTKVLSDLMESEKTQQALYGVADKLVSSFVPDDPRAAEERVRKLASTAAQAGGKAVAKQAKGELAQLQKTIDKYMPYIKPVGYGLAGLVGLASIVIVYKALR